MLKHGFCDVDEGKRKQQFVKYSEDFLTVLGGEVSLEAVLEAKQALGDNYKAYVTQCW